MNHTIKNNVRDCATVPWTRLLAMERNTLKVAEGRDVQKLKHAILHLGFNFPFFIWAEHEYILDGAGRVLALTALEAEGIEIPDLPIVEIYAETLEDAKALVLQASSEHGVVSLESITAFGEGLHMDSLMDSISFPDIDFGKQVNFTAFEKDPDEVPEVPAEPVTKVGDLFCIGGHKLVCGDSTLATNAEKVLDGHKPNLMVTDPPYGVEYDANWRNEADRANGKPYGASAIGEVLNDGRADWREAWAHFPGNIAYVWHAGRHARTVQESLEAGKFVIRNQIIWAKSNFAISRGDYHWKHEPCWYAVRNKGDWTGDRSQTTLWEIDKPLKSETGHSTQKPVECMARPMRNHGKPGDYVYEPFGGSGTTMVAAQMEGRLCLMIELNPKYCDIIVARMRSLFPDLPITRNGEAV